MTKNQIEYAKLQEQRRSNLRQEELTSSRDTTTRELGFANLAEATRHNYATEAHNVQVLGETRRHNLAQETYNLSYLEETSRHNLATEAHNADVLLETSRHNREQEYVSRLDSDTRRLQLTELQRHNVATEAETARSNQARERETERSNVARESEAHRANVARELETNRSNLALETQRSAELQESIRYHSQTVGLGYSQLAEARRSHLASEAETRRSNLAQEYEISRANLAREEENTRSAMAREFETARSNMEQEEIARKRAETAEQQRRDQARFNTRTFNQRERELDLDKERLEEQRRHNVVGEITSGVEAASKVARYIVPIIGGFN